MTASLQDVQAPFVSVRVPAKINLQLSVGPLADSGYHEIATVFQAISLYDQVTVSKVKPGAEQLSISGEGAETLPTNHENLALKAIREIAKYVEHPIHARIHIDKAIPISGGMAGGSADAAAVTVAVNQLWQLNLTSEEVTKIASEVGSDVAFLLFGHTQMGLGRGERLNPLLTKSELNWVIATNSSGLQTSEVYKTCDSLRLGKAVPEPIINKELVQALAAGDVEKIAKNLSNDLQEAALKLKPELSNLLKIGEEYGAIASLVSGSGPTCIFLAASKKAAENLVIDLSGSGLAKNVLLAKGPVAGAKII